MLTIKVLMETDPFATLFRERGVGVSRAGNSGQPPLRSVRASRLKKIGVIRIGWHRYLPLEDRRCLSN